MTNAAAPSQRLHCNKCGGDRVHHAVGGAQCTHRVGTGEYTVVLQDEWRIHQCAGCELTKAVCRTLTSELEVQSEVCYPPDRRRACPDWAQDLPADCQVLLREIYNALSVDCRSLVAMGARAIIDLMLTDMLGDIGGFAHKLKTAVANGMLDATQHGVIADAIDAGHAASHRGFVPTFEQLEDVLVIVEYALKDRYVTQKASDRLKDAVPKREKGG